MPSFPTRISLNWWKRIFSVQGVMDFRCLVRAPDSRKDKPQRTQRYGRSSRDGVEHTEGNRMTYLTRITDQNRGCLGPLLRLKSFFFVQLLRYYTTPVQTGFNMMVPKDVCT